MRRSRAKRRRARPCALPECSEMVGPSYRSHAKYCSPACRAEAARQRKQGEKQSRASKRTETHSSKRDNGEPHSRPRLPSRNGLGTKLYLTPSDLADLELHLPHLSLPVAEKVKQARVRLDQRRMNGDRDSGATAAHAGS